MCIDTDYFETYNRDNVTLVSVRETPIDEFTERGLRIGGGRATTFDVLVLATGFDAMTGALLAHRHPRPRRPLAAREVGGRAALVPRPGVAGFPNLFTITGPGSPSVLSNMMVSIEQHVD